MTLRRRWWLVAGVLVALACAAAWGYGVALQRLKLALEAGLGPRANVASLHLGWNGVEALDVRVRADRSHGGWPVDDELRARRVRLVPALSNLWRRGWRIERVTIEDGYLSALRTRDGKLHIVPGLLARAGHEDPKTTAPRIRIDQVRLVDATLELHDGSVRQPPHRLRVEHLQAEVGPLVLPALDEPVQVELEGTLAGVRHDGRLRIAGEVTPATRDAS